MVVEGSGELRHVVVVGGGITGLAAACALRDGSGVGTGPGPVRVTVLEASGQIGGERVGELAGVAVDEGAESLLLRRPEAVSARAAGLGDDLEDAATTSATVWTRGGLHPLPKATVMGVPSDLRALAASRLLTSRKLAQVPLDSWLPRTRMGEDVSVGRYVADRLGRAVVDRLVEPLLGGVYRRASGRPLAGDHHPAAGTARAPPALAARCRAGEPGSLRRRGGQRGGRRGVRGTARRCRPTSGRRGAAVGGRGATRRHRP